LSAKSFVFYTEVGVEGDLVNCIYLINGNCWAQPFAARTSLERQQLAEAISFYKPTEEDQAAYCAFATFLKCPRFTAYQDHLKAAGLVK
jgi:hypothetical protein